MAPPGPRARGGSEGTPARDCGALLSSQARDSHPCPPHMCHSHQHTGCVPCARSSALVCKQVSPVGTPACSLYSGVPRAPVWPGPRVRCFLHAGVPALGTCGACPYTHTPVSESGASNSTVDSEGPPVLACGDCFCPSPQAQEVNTVISGCLQMRRLRRREVT